LHILVTSKWWWWCVFSLVFSLLKMCFPLAGSPGWRSLSLCTVLFILNLSALQSTNHQLGAIFNRLDGNLRAVQKCFPHVIQTPSPQDSKNFCEDNCFGPEPGSEKIPQTMWDNERWGLRQEFLWDLNVSQSDVAVSCMHHVPTPPPPSHMQQGYMQHLAFLPEICRSDFSATVNSMNRCRFGKVLHATLSRESWKLQVLHPK